MVLETLAHLLFSHQMQVLAPENFTELSHYKSFILYIITELEIKIARKSQME